MIWLVRLAALSAAPTILFKSFAVPLAANAVFATCVPKVAPKGSSLDTATPANWKQGEDVIIVPAVKEEEAKTLFPDGWNAVKPYLRIVKQPKTLN